MTPETMGCLAAAFAWGLALGFIFFWGLWLTVQRLMKSSRPKTLWAGSLALRIALILAGFYPLVRFFPPGIIAAMAGVLAARAYVNRKTSKLSEAE